MIALRSNGPVTSFIRNQNTYNTRKAYTIGLKKFFTWIEDPDAPIRKGRDPTDGAERMAEMDRIAAAYLDAIESGRKPGRDLVDFLAAMARAGFSGASRRVARNAVVGWMEDNDIELSGVEQRNIRKRIGKATPVALEDTISIDTVRQFLPHLRTPYRAVTLVLLATGARIGEVLQLRESDIDFDTTPAKVTIRRETTKTDTRRFSFLTAEAVDAIMAWFAIRDDYIKSARARAANLQNGDGADRDGCLFPFSDTVYLAAWKRALKKAGLFAQCEETGRVTIHPHGLRKFFRTYLGAAAGVDVAEKLMGHEGYLAGAYVRLTEDDLAKAYLQHCHLLETTSGGSAGLRQEIVDIRADNAALRTRIEEMEAVRAEWSKIENPPKAHADDPEFVAAVARAVAAHLAGDH